MFARKFEDEVDGRMRAILDKLSAHVDGLTFNKLCKEADGICARETIRKKLKALVELKLLTFEKIGKQKTRYKPTIVGRRLKDEFSEMRSWEAFYRAYLELARHELENGTSTPSETATNVINMSILPTQFLLYRQITTASPYFGEVFERTLGAEVMEICHRISALCWRFLHTDKKVTAAYTAGTSTVYSYWNIIKDLESSLTKLKSQIQSAKGLQESARETLENFLVKRLRISQDSAKLSLQI